MFWGNNILRKMPVENLYQQLQTFRRGKKDVVT